MPSLRILGGDATDSVAPADVAALVAVTEPLDVRLDEVHAGPVYEVSAEMQVRLVRGQPSFGYVEDQDLILVRLEHTLNCSTSTDQNSTDIRAHHIVAFRVLEEFEVTPATVSAWIETNVYFIAYPYIRQFFTQITASLGLPPVVLGYMKRDEWVFTDSEDAVVSAIENK